VKTSAATSETSGPRRQPFDVDADGTRRRGGGDVPGRAGGRELQVGVATNDRPPVRAAAPSAMLLDAQRRPVVAAEPSGADPRQHVRGDELARIGRLPEGRCPFQLAVGQHVA